MPLSDKYSVLTSKNEPHSLKSILRHSSLNIFLYLVHDHQRELIVANLIGPQWQYTGLITGQYCYYVLVRHAIKINTSKLNEIMINHNIIFSIHFSDNVCCFLTLHLTNVLVRLSTKTNSTASTNMTCDTCIHN